MRRAMKKKCPVCGAAELILSDHAELHLLQPAVTP